MESLDNKILTVSVAAYNVEKYLDETLTSCIPAIRNLDVIVVNDGSKDGTLEVAKKWESRYPDSIRVIDKPNGGYGSTMNASIPLARGDYFRYLDGDDWFEPNQLANYLQVLSVRTEDVVVTPYRKVYENGAQPETKDCLDYLSEGSFEATVLDPNKPIAASAIAYKTELLRSSSFYMTEGCFYTDIEYAYLPMRCVNTLYVSHTPIYQYRIGREGQSVSVEGIQRHYSDLLRVCKRLLREIGSFEGDSSAYLQGCLVKECSLAFRYTCIAGPSPRIKQELRDFDEYIRERSSATFNRMASSSRLVLLLRKTGFLFWGPFCRLVKRRL